MSFLFNSAALPDFDLEQTKASQDIKNKHTHTHTDWYLFVVLVDVAVGELFPAELTLVWFILTVDDLMSRGLIQALETSATDVTGVRTLFYTHIKNTPS